MPKIEVNCFNCDKKFFKYIRKEQKRFFCCKSCEGEYNKGENNPNWNNKWSEEKKNQQSELIRSKVDDDYRKSCSSANKGKTFSPERCRNMSIAHTGLKHSPHSEERKRKIGIASSKKFTNEYKIKDRKKREELGYWIPLEDKSDIEIYYKISQWIYKMFDYITDEQQLYLLKILGIFNARNNKKGIVRDHMYSRRSGYENKVFPEILRHPCNCQLITHSQNIKKKKSRYVDADIITLEDLFLKIKNFKIEWIEQDKVLVLIERYENGERWIR
jgi:hypothetical protein